METTEKPSEISPQKPARKEIVFKIPPKINHNCKKCEEKRTAKLLEENEILLKSLNK